MLRPQLFSAIALFACFSCSSGGGDGPQTTGSGGAPDLDAAPGTGGSGGSSGAGGSGAMQGTGGAGQGVGGSTTPVDAGSGQTESSTDAASLIDVRVSDARVSDASLAIDSGTRLTDAGHTPDTGTVAADGAADPCGLNNPARVPLPVVGNSTFDVRTFGAVGDDKTDDTAFLQAALNAATAAGGGVVTIAAGTYLSGPLTVGSGTQLDLASGATLKMLPMANWPGTMALLNANNAHDIALTGSGTIEGQGQAWWNALTATPTLTRPQEVVFNNSTRVLISGIHLQNPPEEHILVKQDTNVTITGITIQTLAVTGQHGPSNTDGVDVSATGMFFCGNSITCGDDNIAMGGTSLYVAYSSFGVGHGCSIGSITEKGVNGLTVDHMTFNGTTSGIRMKSARDRGGLVQNLT
ncbi:MAG TPA: glycosyl hydrolase family 28 protein, partial [Polyangiaceae bacterium]